MSAVADFANECRDYLIAVAESVEDTIANLDAIIPLEDETLEGVSDDRT